VDYQQTAGTVTFTPSPHKGKTPTERFIIVPVYGDTTPEDDETFTVKLSNPIAAA
jgi:hypothetical protein